MAIPNRLRLTLWPSPGDYRALAGKIAHGAPVVYRGLGEIYHAPHYVEPVPKSAPRRRRRAHPKPAPPPPRVPSIYRRPLPAPEMLIEGFFVTVDAYNAIFEAIDLWGSAAIRRDVDTSPTPLTVALQYLKDTGRIVETPAGLHWQRK